VKLRAEPWRIDAVFRRLEYILDALDLDGTLTTTAAGVADLPRCRRRPLVGDRAGSGGVACAFEMPDGRKRVTHKLHRRYVGGRAQRIPGEDAGRGGLRRLLPRV
jgi:hypothetical protein